MTLLPLDLLHKRVEASRAESTAALFQDLLYLGEALLKTYTAAIVAGLPDETNRHRYRLCHKLLRASGIGEWDEVLADVSTGPASQHLLPGAISIQQELTQQHSRGSWVYEAAKTLHRSLSEVVPGVEPLATRIDGRRWFSLLVQFRNKTKGHGAPSNNTVTRMIEDFESSIILYLENSAFTKLPWAFLKRNLSGKYHVVALCGTSVSFDRLKNDRVVNLQDGIYIDLGELCRVELMETSIDLNDFYYPNGHFRQRQRTCEWLSYISGTRQELDATAYTPPATTLPPSSTEGNRMLDVLGGCFANLPPQPSDYVSREELETDLTTILSDDRHPIATLTGRGGIGKTSLALQVLHKIAHSVEGRFAGIVWMSARDIDLLPQGPKLVKPETLTIKDMAHQFASLFQPIGWAETHFDENAYLAQQLRLSEIGPLLLIFDNFETVQQPIDLYQWLDIHIRCPNKILITTRHRDFKGDYPVEVNGMTERQCDELVYKSSEALGISASITRQFLKDVYRESEGHPYVIKILLGEAADGKKSPRIERVVAGRDDLLNALFERTYTRLAPSAKLVFLILSNWRSLVSQSALDAALLRPSQPERIDTLAAVEELRRVAFVDEHVSPKDGSVFINVPLVAALFGRRKLSVSPERIQIDDNTKILQRFGAMQLSDLQHGIEPRIHRFFGSLSEDLAHKKVTLSKETPLIELVAGSFPPAWLMVADLWRESDDPSAPLQVKTALSRYLEMTTRGTKQKVAWDRLAAIYRNGGNWPEFVDTQIHIAELPGADIDGISAAVNTFNSVTRHLDSTARLNFAQRLAAVMEPKITEGDATDCSRLAWVLLYCDRAPEALKTLDRGLRLEPTNEFCRSLKAKIWEKKLDAARIAGDQIGALDASVHLVEIPGAEFSDISETANTINKTGDIERDLRWTLSRRLMNVMEPKILNGDATDYSRLAWLMIHAGELERAHAIVERGLSLDANSEHCLRLKARLASHLHAY